MNTTPDVLEALRCCAELVEDCEALPYPLKVRFRVACYGAALAVTKAEGRDCV